MDYWSFGEANENAIFVREQGLWFPLEDVARRPAGFHCLELADGTPITDGQLVGSANDGHNDEDVAHLILSSSVRLRIAPASASMNSATIASAVPQRR